MKDLKTERLALKQFTLGDAADLYAYAKNPGVGPRAGWKPHENIEESEKIIRELFLPSETWAIRLKGSSKVIGSISLEEDRYRPDAGSKELGYSLSEEHWGKGYMTEAAKEVIRFAFEELGLEQLGICTGPENKRSRRVIEKCGFKYEGTIRRTYKTYNGLFRDSLLYSMLREEYGKIYKEGAE